MRDALSTRGRPQWSLAIETGVWLGAAFLLLAQIGCFAATAVPATSGNLHLQDATFTPEFVKLKPDPNSSNELRRQSHPAQVRYWVATGHPFTVTWPEVKFLDCNLCGRCPPPEPTFPNPPTVSVRFQGPMTDSITDAVQFEWLSGCPRASGGPAVFIPTETGQYRAYIFFAGADPIASEPGAWFPINVLKSSFTLPPRLLRYRPPMGDTPEAWEWTGRVGDKVLKEAFDPRLRVGRVKILVGTCSAPGLEPRDDECGGDLLMDPAFARDRDRPMIAPHYVRVKTEGFALFSPQDCRGALHTIDGNIDFGPNPNDPTKSLCEPHHINLAFTPNYPSELLLESDDAGIPLTWRVEFNQAENFPPPDPGKQLWIEFTLVPSR